MLNTAQEFTNGSALIAHRLNGYNGSHKGSFITHGLTRPNGPNILGKLNGLTGLIWSNRPKANGEFPTTSRPSEPNMIGLFFLWAQVHGQTKIHPWC